MPCIIINMCGLLLVRFPHALTSLQSLKGLTPQPGSLCMAPLPSGKAWAGCIFYHAKQRGTLSLEHYSYIFLDQNGLDGH